MTTKNKKLVIDCKRLTRNNYYNSNTDKYCSVGWYYKEIHGKNDGQGFGTDVDGKTRTVLSDIVTINDGFGTWAEKFKKIRKLFKKIDVDLVLKNKWW